MAGLHIGTLHVPQEFVPLMLDPAMPCLPSPEFLARNFWRQVPLFHVIEDKVVSIC